MIYPNNFESKIGFSEIRSQIRSYCLGEEGRELCDQISFLSMANSIQRLLDEVEEMQAINQRDKRLPLTPYYDMRLILRRLSTEGLYLEVEQLYHLKESLLQVKRITSHIKGIHELPLDRLREIIQEVPLFTNLVDYLSRIIDENGGLVDSASPELADIRRALRKEQQSLSRKLEHVLSQAKQDGLVEAGVNVAMRDGRLVIPIIAGNKRKIKGIIHDESGTGKTAYVEPSSVVQVNNRITELRAEEQREVIRILKEVSAGIRPHREEIMISLSIIAVFDLIHAKAKYANLIEAEKPKLTEDHSMTWENARHPLLQRTLKSEGREIVPLSLRLDEKHRILLISGPNAGGKSVALKTAGLIQYMIQCGIQPPVSRGSKVRIFKRLFIDIGDDQSLANDLSTYSSHLSHMKYFMQHGNSDTLILIDEFGTGTEPQIGGAIAEAILEELNARKMYGVITTHYTNLKHFASEHEGIINGAMLYDQHHMQALFKLEVGMPGSSFAIEIARKIGISSTIVDKVFQKVGDDALNYDKYLREIVRDKSYWAKKRENIRRQNAQMEKLIGEYTKGLKDINKREKEILAQANAANQNLLKEANISIEHTIKKIKESNASSESIKRAQEELKDLRGKLEKRKNHETISGEIIQKVHKQVGNKPPKKEISPKAEESPKSLQVGDFVNVDNHEGVYEILELNKKHALVALGMLKMKIKADQLKSVSRNQAKKQRKSIQTKPTISNNYLNERKIDFKGTLDLRGKRVHEVWEQLDQFVDDAIMAGSREIRVLHGTGTGAVKSAVREHLSANPIIRRVRDEDIQMGGAGISVIELDL